VHPAAIAREVARELPFLATTKLLVAAVRAGAGREAAHAAIQEQATAVARALREDPSRENDLVRRLEQDPRLGPAAREVAKVLVSPLSLAGLAEAQVRAFVREVEALAARYPEAAAYEPDPIL
jgi:adenylosuccinate lyase